jgi:hypothetical protein
MEDSMRHAATRTAVPLLGSALAAAFLAAPPAARAQARTPATPPEMVAAYDALADAILGADKAEEKLVHSILAATYAHAQAELARARQALKAGDAAAAKANLESVAAAVGQIGTEGDNAVAGVRKRLVQGGHHHNAAGEAQGLYDEGYVVVTKAAKQAFLDSSKAIAMLARDPKADALDVEWKKVEAAWAKHIVPGR